MAIYSHSQVGLGEYHFRINPCVHQAWPSLKLCGFDPLESRRGCRLLHCADNMTYRIRHCVFCPHCLTRYLIGFSPYANGAYLESIGVSSAEEYVLYCSCRDFPAPSRWRESETRPCGVSNFAYHRGYGTPDEIWFADHGPHETDSLRHAVGKISSRSPRDG